MKDTQEILSPKQLLSLIPHASPFRFVDEILEVNENSIKGVYTFREDEFFYKGHFPQMPVTPGVILTEAMAQIGLLALGMYILHYESPQKLEALGVNFFFTSSEVKFKKAVYPGEKVIVQGEKIQFKHQLLKSRVKLYKENQELACHGTMAGILAQHTKPHE